MARKTQKVVLGVAAVAFCSAVLVVSCNTVGRVILPPPMIPGATFVGMDTCGACHEKLVKDFKLSSHARVTIPGEGERTEGGACESCHGPGSIHVEKGSPDTNGGHIINPGKNPESCFGCHLDKKAQFNLPYHHPVREGRMSCGNCHDVHGADVMVAKNLLGRGATVGRINETCGRCHREQFRPHVFEHEALREGCQVCHNVHGSINDKMLTERDNNLCLKCHAQTPSPTAAARSIFIGDVNHTAFLTQGPCYSGGCHSAVHGSNLNAHLRF